MESITLIFAFGGGADIVMESLHQLRLPAGVFWCNRQLTSMGGIAAQVHHPVLVVSLNIPAYLEQHRVNCSGSV